MHRRKPTLTGCLLGLGLVLAAGQPAHATTAVWDNTFTPSPWARGITPGSLYAEWNVFNDDIAGGNIQDTSPEVANFGGGAYQVAETTGTAILTSGGNIYGPAQATAFQFDVGNAAGGPRDFHLRIASVGNFDATLNQSFINFQLNGLNGTYQGLFSGIPGPQGIELEGLVSWLGVPGASSYVLTWNAVGSSVSLDQLSLDVGPVAAVPLPAAAHLMGSGLVGIAAIARRRHHAV
jgi:hypothetical protein